jgi:hypothetical protein
MVDAKKFLLSSGTTTAESGTLGSLPSVGADGLPTVLHASQEGVLYVSLTNPGGTAPIEVVADQSPASATPSIFLTGGVFRSALPTYADGDAAIFHMDDRGRLLVSYGEGPDTADVEADESVAPANPKGTFGVTKVGVPGTAYTLSDAAVFRSDLYGRLLVHQGGRNSADTASLEVSVETDNDPGPATPIGTFPMALYRSSLPTYVDGDAGILHVDSSGRLIVSLGSDVSTDNSPGPSNPNGTFQMALYRSTLPTYANGDAANLHVDNRGRLRVAVGAAATTTDTEDSAATANPTGTYVLGNAVTGTGFPTYANNDATVPQTDPRGRLFVSFVNPTTGDLNDVTADNDAAPTNPAGIWPMGKYQSTLPTYANNDAAVLHVSSNGVLLTETINPANATVSTVSAVASSTTLLAANADRRGGSVYNDSATATLYLKFGTAASASSHTVQVGPGGFYELPGPTVYTGIIHGRWTAAVGNARITEVTP